MVLGGKQANHLGFNALPQAADARGKQAGLRFHRLLCGGRVVKWRGRPASCAPGVAEIFTGLARRALPALLAAAVTGTDAWAEDQAELYRWWAPYRDSGPGGPGLWNTTDPTWSTKPDGSGPYTLWNNVRGGIAVFSGKPGTVTVVEGEMVAHGLVFETDGYRFEGWSTVSLAANPTITLAGTDITATFENTLAVKESDLLRIAGGGRLVIAKLLQAPGVEVRIEGTRVALQGNAVYEGGDDGSLLIAGNEDGSASLTLTGQSASMTTGLVELGEFVTGSGRAAFVLEGGAKARVNDLVFNLGEDLVSTVDVTGKAAFNPSRLSVQTLAVYHQKSATVSVTDGGEIDATHLQIGGEPGFDPIWEDTAATINVSGDGRHQRQSAHRQLGLPLGKFAD